MIARMEATIRPVASMREVKEIVRESLRRMPRNPHFWGGHKSYPDYSGFLAGLGMSDAFEADVLKLILNAVAIANIADNAASGPLTNLYVALHTADPGETGDQTTSETVYTNYLRVAIARNSGTPAWTVSGTTQAVNAGAITFAQCGTTGATITNVSIGVASSSTSKALFMGPLSSPASLAVSNGITPSFAASALTITLD